jgi:hypothetical protein
MDVSLDIFWGSRFVGNKQYLEALVGVSRGKGPLQSCKGHNKREKKGG